MSPIRTDTTLQPRGRRRLALLLVSAGLLLGLAAAELLVRATGVAPEVSPVRRGRFQLSANPRLVFEPVPGMRVEARDGGGVPLFFGYPGRANRLGYRDRDHEPTKPPGTYRIVVIGDSVAAGWGVEETADLFAPRLERLLNGRANGPAEERSGAVGKEGGTEGGTDGGSQRFEVLNFAVTGYNTAQQVETLASRALLFHPDLVLVAYCLNDRWPPDPRLVAALREMADEESSAGRRPVLASQVGRGATRLLYHSALYRLARFRVFAKAPEAAELPVLNTVEDDAGHLDAQGRPALDGGRAVFGPGGEPISGAQGVRAAFQRLSDLADREGFEVLVAIFPHQKRPYRYYAHHRQVAGFAEAEGFAVADLIDTFKACHETSGEAMAFDRFHLTAAGHACAARALEDELRSGALLADALEGRPGD